MLSLLFISWKLHFHFLDKVAHIDEIGLTTDDWDAVERLRDFYERFLSNHFPEVDVEAVIGEMDFNLHPSIIIHRHQGYKKMAAFHFGLDRNGKTISGYILAFKK